MDARKLFRLSKKLLTRGFRLRAGTMRRVRPSLEALEPMILPNAVIASGAGAGAPPMVRVYDATTGKLSREFLAYDPTFTGGVNVAVADFNADGTADIVTGAGAGGGPHVKVFDGATGAKLLDFMAYDRSLRGGVNVAAGTFNGVGWIVTGSGPGGGPHVKVFDTTGDMKWDVMAFGVSFRGGVHVAVGQVGSIAGPSVVVGAGQTGGPQVRVYNGTTHALARDFMAFDPDFSGGVNVSVGDLNGDGTGEVVTGAGPGGGPQVKVFHGNTGAVERSFFAGSTTLRGGVSVAAAHLRNRPGNAADIVALPGGVTSGMAVVFDGGTGLPVGGPLGQFPGAPSGPGGGASIAFAESEPGHACAIPYDVDNARWICGFDQAGPVCQLPDKVQGDWGLPGQAAPDISPGGIRYTDGVVLMPATDLYTGGPVGPWGQTRSWSNKELYSLGSYNGAGWVTSDLPSLLKTTATAEDQMLVVVSNAMTARVFDVDEFGSAQPRDFFQNRIVADPDNDQYVLTDPTGAQMRFWDFVEGVSSLKFGQFQSYKDPAGNVTQVTAQAGDRPGEVQRSSTVGGTTITESYLYTYNSGGVNDGTIASVTLRRKVNNGSWTPIRRVDYAYYGELEAHGNAQDLKTATIKDLTVAGEPVIDTQYYRYYTTLNNETGGYKHALKYAFGPASYERLKQAYYPADPTTVDDNDAAPYADHHFKYDGLQRVVEHVVQGDGCSTCTGGLGTYSYACHPSRNSFRFWR
jgi:hypothetical protein